MNRGAILRVARSHLGVAENPRGSNSGPSIDKWLFDVGLKPGQPWCAAFVCGVIREANGGVRPLWWRQSGAALGLMAHNGGLLLKDHREVQPEDVYVYDHGKGQGHTGIVESVRNDGGVITFRDISGNSNDEGSREGYEVCSNTRKLDDPRLVAILRLPLA